jgi:hypothetical protein
MQRMRFRVAMHARARRRTRTLPPPRGSQTLNVAAELRTIFGRAATRVALRRPITHRVTPRRQNSNHWRAVTRPGWDAQCSNNLAGDLTAWPWKCRRRQSDHTPLGWRRRHETRRSSLLFRGCFVCRFRFPLTAGKHTAPGAIRGP